ncbi:MAG: alpha/beta hydrolase [Pseudomonadaceae bacterium]|nr:MAG: alpha/beta hydrolase [Pseudomonadaceae bacterium]
MPSFEHQMLQLDSIELSLYSTGPADGPVVWLLHGFPECWYSWRHQMTALGAAGYRVMAPEMRGYGKTSAPKPAQAYDIITLCGDIQQAMDQLGHQSVAMIGHDWGAPVAWHLALLEPERVAVVGALSVPYGGRPKRPAIEVMRELYQDKFHYMLYFQQPDRAEAELAENIPRTMRVIMHGMSSTDAGNSLVQDKPADARWLDDQIDAGEPPAWCPPEAFQVYVDTFARSGFHGPINWYRNFERNWQATADLAGRQITQPALFVIGDRDPVGQLEAYTIKKMPSVVPRVEQHEVPDCGHWIQAEQPDAVNHLLLDFLQRHYPAS